MRVLHQEITRGIKSKELTATLTILGLNMQQTLMELQVLLMRIIQVLQLM